jgi:perosamine synthetase
MNRISELERSYAEDVLSNQFSSSKNSIYTKKFEQKFAEYIGVEHAIAFCNGTATMHACLEAIGLQPGDEVIVPPLTMSATTFAVLHANGTPIFADVEPDTFLIDPKSIEQRISSNTKAIITVSLYGLSPDMDKICALANSKGIYVIEDNAEAYGASYKNNMVGSLGIAGSFSLQASKHLTTGEGGIVTTNDTDFALRVRRAQSLGYAGLTSKSSKIDKSVLQEPGYARHVSMGWNYRMSELCSAVALAQTERLTELVAVRSRAAEAFARIAADYKSILQPQHTPADRKNSYWTWVCKLDDSIGWLEFRNKFLEYGGDGIYSPWLLTYNEPMFTNRSLMGRDRFFRADYWDINFQLLCPVAQSLERSLLQFKTNYYDQSKLRKQLDALYNTLNYFDK